MSYMFYMPVMMWTAVSAFLAVIVYREAGALPVVVIAAIGIVTFLVVQAVSFRTHIQSEPDS